MNSYDMKSTDELKKIFEQPLLTPNELRKLVGLEPIPHKEAEPPQVRRCSFNCKNCGSNQFITKGLIKPVNDYSNVYETTYFHTCNYCGTTYEEANK